MDRLWFVARSKQKTGPFSLAQLQEQARSGELLPGDMLLEEGAARWIPAASLEALFPAATAPPEGTEASGVRSAVTLQPSQDEHATLPPEPGDAMAALGPLPAGYELLGELGRGGMGVVYKARQAGLNRVVALKMILAGEHAGTDERVRFLAEAEAIARVRHPGIVQVYDFGSHAGLPYFSLELCEGGSLAGRLSEGPLPPSEAAQVVEQVARAVQAAHAAGIVHRDLKPHNVLLAADGAPRVTDFGLAKRTEAAGHTVTGPVMGTPSYMSPEQASGRKDVGPATDVWALGAVLYECLTGRPPFKAATVMDTLMQVVTEEPVPVRQLNRSVPSDLETICHTCLRKEPGRRYASAGEMADDLKRFTEGRPIAARPVGRLERLWSWYKREPRTAALVAAVAAALVAGTAVAWGLAGWALGEKGRADREAVRAGLKAKEADDNAEDAAKKAKEADDNAERALAKEKRAEKAAKDEKAARAQAEEDKKAAEFQAFRAEDARHAIQMDLALRMWEKHDVAEAERVLGEVSPPFQQTWETRHVRSLCRRKALPLRGHVKDVDSVSFSPDGNRIATCSADKTVRVWDTETGQELLCLKGHANGVLSVAYSPDGKRIASGSFDNTARVWDARTGKELFCYKGHANSVLSVSFSPDSKRIATGSRDKTARVWDAQTGQEKLSLNGHTATISSVAFSPDGKHIASSGDNTVRVWDARTDQETLHQRPHGDRPRRGVQS